MRTLAVLFDMELLAFLIFTRFYVVFLCALCMSWIVRNQAGFVTPHARFKIVCSIFRRVNLAAFGSFGFTL
ncbi:hypothetical protein SAMN04490191_6137 [Pseudomonas lini]|uniref:Uncharacterized protein n=1 Tax=Pseudomonas lini TaxID=163011 RepID=A0A1H2C9Q2_9PSED|nr:hypothetical protein SAMN04490191_6137 [Pseudomonas lini]